MSTIFDFSWDPRKASENFAKHRVSFRQASSVFDDPMQATMFDEDHSDDEDRWVTLGRAKDGPVLVVVHTTEEVGVSQLHIRIISARRADRDERKQYEQMPR